MTQDVFENSVLNQQNETLIKQEFIENKETTINNPSINIIEQQRILEEQRIAEDQYWDKKVSEFIEAHKDETPDEWGRSLSYFVGPIIFCICSLVFIIVQKPTIYLLLITLMMNVCFTLYNVLSWYNQRIYIYSDRLEYHFGLWNSQIKTFHFGTDDIVQAQSGAKKTLLQKYMDFSNFYIINKKNIPFKMERIASPDGLLDFLTNKVVEFNRFFDASYQVQPKENITRKGVFVEDADGNWVLKSKNKNNT